MVYLHHAARSYAGQSDPGPKFVSSSQETKPAIWPQGRLALRQNDFDPALYHFKDGRMVAVPREECLAQAGTVEIHFIYDQRGPLLPAPRR
jgi:hypothetical protein